MIDLDQQFRLQWCGIPHAVTDEMVQLVILARCQPSASRIDRAIVCGTFGVSSGEEASFENDIFSVLYDPKASDGKSPAQDNNPVGLFATLMSVLENNAALDRVADGSNITTILTALAAAPVSADPPTDAYQISISGATLDIGASGANDGYCISAALYRQTTAKGSIMPS